MGKFSNPTLEAQLSLIQAEVDPMMVDAANDDFTLSPNSPAVGAGVDGVTLGDPRWWPNIIQQRNTFLCF